MPEWLRRCLESVYTSRDIQSSNPFIFQFLIIVNFLLLLFFKERCPVDEAKCLESVYTSKDIESSNPFILFNS